jgi:hypothetical protein
MLQQATIGDRILELVKEIPDCTLEEVTQAFSELHWSDVYLEVDRLSRSGYVRLIQDNVQFTTTLRLT